MPRITEVSLDQTQKCIELRRSGWNYTQIGKGVGLDRRVVARIIKSQQKAERLEQVAAARRDVAGSYFRKHIEDIEIARSYLLQIIAPPSMRIGINALTANVAEELLLLLNKHLMARGGYDISVTFKENVTAAEWHQPEYKRVLDMRTAEREAKETIEGFKEHLPSLWPKVEAWKLAAEGYNTRLKKEFEELKSIAGDLGLEKTVIGAAIRGALALILDKGYPSEDEGFFSSSYRLNFSPDAAKYLRQAPRARRYLDMLVSSWRELERAFKEIEDMISPSQLHRALLTSHCQFCPVP
jgi:hypothetical protein